MVKNGVKAVYSDDKATVTVWTYPSKNGFEYKLTKKTWKNECPLCTKISNFKKKGKLKFNPKNTDEGELTCEQCGADFCGVSGQDKNNKVRGKLVPATVKPNNATKVAESQTKSQSCSLTKAEALTKAKQKLETKSTYKGQLKIPIIKDINLGDLVNINLEEFPQTKGKNLYIDSIKEDIDSQTYTIDLIEGKNHLDAKYDGSYTFKNKKGQIITNKNNDNPLQAKCSRVNINIGLKDNSSISKKIKLKGQKLGTVDKIYKWLRVKQGGGTGGWKYKKYGNHIVSSEDENKFGSKSAEKCWNKKTANCCDFAWIMAKLGEGAGKKIGVKKGTYTAPNGQQLGHMWNYCGSKYYDCSDATNMTIDWKKVEKVK